jgi:hypothetical protein
MLLRSSCQSWMTGRHQNRFLLSRSWDRRFCCSDPSWRGGRGGPLLVAQQRLAGLTIFDRLLREGSGFANCCATRMA